MPSNPSRADGRWPRLPGGGSGRSFAPTLVLLLGCLGVSFGLVGMAAANDEFKLRLEPVAGSSGQQLPLSHPAQASADAVANVLKNLEYSESRLLGRGNRQSVFDADEIQSLAPALAEALATAAASEQVRFASFSRRSGTLAQVRKTEAVAFVDANGLFNLAFTGIHEFAGPDTDYFAFLELTDRNPMALQRSLLSLEIARSAHTAGTMTKQPERPLWVRADLGTAAAAPIAGAPDPDTSQGQPAAASRAAPAATGNAVDTAPAGSGQAGELEVRQRLEFLKGLYEDGLISAEEYQQKRREALQRLD